MSVLLVTKRSPWCKIAQQLAPSLRQPLQIIDGDRGDRLPQEITAWSGDWLISFYSPWIFPSTVLGSAKKGALNIHPASPDYPGMGGYDFALRDKCPLYGATLHYMLPRVDSGPIVEVRRVAVWPNDTVSTLQARTSIACLALLEQLFSKLRLGCLIVPDTKLKWSRAPYTQRDLECITR